MRRTHDAGGSIDRAAVVVAVAEVERAKVNTAPDPQGHAVGYRWVGQRMLQFQHCSDRIEGIVERGVHTVPGHLHQAAAVVPDSATGDGVVVRKRLAHARGLLLP